MPEDVCQHVERTDGICTACGHCVHEIILNGACMFCGSTDIDGFAVSPKPVEHIVPVSRLVRTKPAPATDDGDEPGGDREGGG